MAVGHKIRIVNCLFVRPLFSTLLGDVLRHLASKSASHSHKEILLLCFVLSYLDADLAFQASNKLWQLLRLYNVGDKWIKYGREALLKWYWLGKSQIPEKICPNTTVSTTNFTRTSQGLNSCLRGVRLATSRPSNGAAVRRKRKRECGDTCVPERKQKIHYSKVSWVMPARPYDKRVL